MIKADAYTPARSYGTCKNTYTKCIAAAVGQTKTNNSITRDVFSTQQQLPALLCPQLASVFSAACEHQDTA